MFIILNGKLVESEIKKYDEYDMIYIAFGLR